MAAVSSWAEIHLAARLLQVPPERLEGAVTKRVMVSPEGAGKVGGATWSTRSMDLILRISLVSRTHPTARSPDLCQWKVPLMPGNLGDWRVEPGVLLLGQGSLMVPTGMPWPRPCTQGSSPGF